jgi:CRP/FNR family transcriptional regulator
MKVIPPRPVLPDLAALFPILQGDLGREFGRVAARLEYAPHERLYEEGFPCPFVPFLVSGRIRVFKISETGREVTLYRVEPGEVCVLSAICSVQDRQFSVVAESETHSLLYIVPGGEFRRLLRRYWELQAFMLGLMSARLMGMIALVDDVAFRRVGLRVAERLLRETAPPSNPVVTLTHAELAIELGTSREVVSRKLKELERAGLVHLARGRVELVNRPGLAAFRDHLHAELG